MQVRFVASDRRVACDHVALIVKTVNRNQTTRNARSELKQKNGRRNFYTNDKEKNTFNKLKCIQINLHYSKSASLHFYKNITDLNIEIAIIQEPFACLNKCNNELWIPSVPSICCVHHNIDNAYGVIIQTKRSLLLKTVPDPSSNVIMYSNKF